jgi:archaemetzincin
MKIGVLPIGQVDEAILIGICEGLTRVFPDTTCVLVDQNLPLRHEAFDQKRKQYRSKVFLREVQGFAVKNPDLNCVLGIIDVDIFIRELNFVFGEAAYLGKAALISLWRLRPEFYGAASSGGLFFERAVKEAVHEVGHTLGLGHCSRASCVMHFSHSISDTDIKQSVLCDRCFSHSKIDKSRLGKCHE